MKNQIKQYHSKNREQEEFTMMLLAAMPEEKKAVLKNALARNSYFTSAWTLEFGTLTVYKEGWYIELNGTQSGFKVFVLDNDRFDETGTVPFKVIRKPVDSKLHPLYQSNLHLWESDYDRI